MDIGLALGGAVFTETIYSLPGLGQHVDPGARQLRHARRCRAIIVFATVAIIVFNLIVDLLYACIDPRIRLA